MRRRWVFLGVVLAVAVPIVSWGTARALAARRLRAELEQADRDMHTGFLGKARQRLARLEKEYPGEGEVEYQLGRCELAQGRRIEALAAWARVPQSSPYADKAAALRGMHLLNMGRYTPSEEVLLAAPRRSAADSFEVDRALSRLYRFQGRVDDARRVIRGTWGRDPNPSGMLKELWLLDKAPFPVEAWQLALEKADKDDDRVWLGRANLAILTGRLDESVRWLDACLKRRPDDPAVWRCRLDWALAAQDVEQFWAAIAHLPASRFLQSEVLEFRAWLAARQGDRELERRALLALVEKYPGTAHAWERLAALAWEAGQLDEAQRMRRRKAEIDDIQDRYRKLLFLEKGEIFPHAEELGKLTAALGRRFESHGWSFIQAVGHSSDGPVPGDLTPWDDGPGGAVARGEPENLMLADVLKDLRGSSVAASKRPAHRSVASHPDFVDDAEPAGLSSFIFDNGQTPLHQLPEIMSGGVGLLDYDGDGWLDVYAVQGGPLADDPTQARDGDHLFRNNRDGTFTDVTERARISSLSKGYGLGVAVGDFDNDGHPDVFVTHLRSYALYRNRGDGTFEDVTVAAGLAGVRDNPTSAAFADLDGDGDLDLYVCHYMLYDPEHPRVCMKDGKVFFYCDPSKVDPAPDHVFRNDGGRFVDVTAEAGFVDPGGRGLGVVIADLDDDNKPDLYVANDGTANYLFHNRGGFKFEEVAHESGAAGNADGGYQAGMGVGCGDLDGDGRPDLFVTNFYGEGVTLYRNLGGGLFTDRSAASGLGTATRYRLGFGIAPIDFDNDARLDVMLVNGHVNDNRPYYPFAMPAQLFAGDGTGQLLDVSDRAGPPWKVLRVGRGLAVGDLDNNGRVDAVVLAQNDPLAYFHNRTKAGRFVTLRLEGTRSNRDAVGARVTLTAGGRRQVAQRVGGGSYQSAGDPRLHFGLGEAARVESIEVRWPSGRVDRYENLDADTGYRLIEGDPAPKPLAGFARAGASREAKPARPSNRNE